MDQEGRQGEESISARCETVAVRAPAGIIDSATQEFPEPDFEVPVQDLLGAADERLRELKEARIEGRTDDGSVNVVLDGRGRYKEIGIAEQLVTYPTRIAPKLVLAIARGRSEVAKRLADTAVEREEDPIRKGNAAQTLNESMAAVLDAGTRDFDMPIQYRAVVDAALQDLARACEMERAHARRIFEREVARKAGRIQMSGKGDVIAIELRDHAVRDLGIPYLKVQFVTELNALLDAAQNALVEAYANVTVGGVPIGGNIVRIRQNLGL